ncbi:MAG: hypothetical protein DHS20C16_00390 [Phycisphaerae bacterium]|nr:MAG: hypothetical protein DHS20C16_00390 [Phycisphaerae bacterium]
MPEFIDDPTIENDAELWRRVHPKLIVADENRNSIRVSTAAFNDPSMSVVLAKAVLESGRTARDVLVGREGFALTSITAGLARECNQGIARDPVDDEVAHAVVFGNKPRSVKKTFVRHSQWVIPPVVAM